MMDRELLKAREDARDIAANAREDARDEAARKERASVRRWLVAEFGLAVLGITATATLVVKAANIEADAQNRVTDRHIEFQERLLTPPRSPGRVAFDTGKAHCPELQNGGQP